MRLLTPLRRLLGVALFIAIPISREWSSHVLRFVSAIWVIIPFYAFGGEALATHALIGALINMVFSTCIYSAYEEVLYSIEGIRDFFLASPLTDLEFRAGLSLGIFLTTLPSIVICLVPLFILTKSGPSEVVLIIMMLSILWAVSTLIGYLIPIRKNVLATGNVIRVLTLVLVAIPPVYYPLHVWPEQIRPLTYLFPTFNIAELMKLTLKIEPPTPQHTATTATALAIEAAIITLIALKHTKHS